MILPSSMREPISMRAKENSFEYTEYVSESNECETYLEFVSYD